MLRYAVKRILSAIPLMLVISFLVFMFIHLIPGDPIRIALGKEATSYEVEELRETMGLNDPLMTQYLRYMKGLLSGDFGNSIKNGATVAATVGPKFVPTLTLTLLAIGWSVVIGILLGVLAAVKRGKLLDYFSMVVAISGISAPSFWLGLMLMQLFCVKLGWLPVSGLDTWKGYILPAFTMGCGVMAIIARFTRSSMLENLKEDYIRTARAKGLREYWVIMRHAFKNSLIQVVTVVGLQIGGLLTGSVMVETVFSINGLGRLLVTSIGNRDYKVVQFLLLFFSLEYIIINLIVDILYGVLNPKVRYD